MIELHPKIEIKTEYIGEEKAPLMVVDNFIQAPEQLRAMVKGKKFSHSDRFYPGVRLPAPEEYRLLFLSRLSKTVLDFFELSGEQMAYSMCHYSLVTLPPEKLNILQRIPHFDSLEHNGLATVHYLFTKPLGGTAFYRHKKTGFEYIDNSRKRDYFKSLESENDGPNMPDAAYINGETPLFEQLAAQEGVYNRMLIYKRNSLHSGCIPKNFIPDANPEAGRLSINSFIDVL